MRWHRLVAACAALSLSLAPAASGQDTRVFTLGNASTGNEVIAYTRRLDGGLTELDRVPTGGTGSGVPLGSQEALASAADGRFLLAVNALSNDVTVLGVEAVGLRVLDVEASGGAFPTSVTERDGVVYVLNAGVPNRVTGFRLRAGGDLVPIAGASYFLSGPQAAPAQVTLCPRGEFLVVTERATDLISVFRVGPAGRLGPRKESASSGQTPFGFAFGPGRQLFVSEAFAAAPDASATSAYVIEDDATLTVRDASVPTTETAACWTALSRDFRHVYVTNTHSGTITGYRIGAAGLVPLDADGVTGDAGPGSGPLDVAIDSSDRFLHTLNLDGSISTFARTGDGRLTPLAKTTGVPLSATGLVAR